MSRTVTAAPATTAAGCPVSRCLKQAQSYADPSVLRQCDRSSTGSQPMPPTSPSSRSGTGSPSGSDSGSSSLSSQDENVMAQQRMYNASVYAFTSNMWQDLRKDIERRASGSS